MRLVDSTQMQEMDHYTIETIGIPGIVLMENAARSWVDAAELTINKKMRLFVFCGSGNNGGDGYAIARNLVNRGYECLVIAVKPPKTDDCKKNAAIWDHFGKTIQWDDFISLLPLTHPNDVVVDAILGTGVETAIRGELVDILNTINQLAGLKMAVDIPSGISASTGDLLGVGIKANQTITFQKEKIGHHMFPGKLYSGQVLCQNISIMERYPKDAVPYYLLDSDSAGKRLPAREPDHYKNKFGHLVTWCGAVGTLGAAILASRAGMKTGVGLTTAALPDTIQNLFVSHTPEIMTFSQEKITTDWLSQFNALVLGCGLGREIEKWQEIIKIVVETDLPVVLDADAFYGIPDIQQFNPEKTVLTPHPGEFVQLTGMPKPKTNKERIEQGFEFVRKKHFTLVLKGAPTLVFTSDGNLFINSTGNVGMATAGSGDVLSGIIGGFLAQGLSPDDAALLGTWLHGKSGDLFRDENCEESLTAPELIGFMGSAIRWLRDKSTKMV